MARLLSLTLVGSILVLAGCQGRHVLGGSPRAQLQPVPVPAEPAPPPVAAAAQAGGAEQAIDTNVKPATKPAEPATIAAAKAPEAPKVRTPSDDHLPKWVPARGRLTVVESSDLAENLGLVPKGATKKSPDERISVADKLAEESAQRAKSSDPMTKGTSWSYSKPGRVTNHRF